MSIANYHNLAGRDVSGSIFMRDKNGFHEHSTSLGFSMISNLFNNKITKVSKERIEQSKAYTYKCYNINNQIESIYIINWSGKDLYYPIEDSLNLVHSIYSENLYNHVIHINKSLSIEECQLDKDSCIIVEPYSISLIHNNDE